MSASGGERARAATAGVGLATLRALIEPFYPGSPGDLPAPAGSLDFVEVFAGDQSISRGMRMLGYRGLSLDQRYDPSHNVLCPVGLMVLLHAVLNVRPGGVLWAAPPCSTWVWMSRFSSGRYLHVAGDPRSEYVRGQNALVERLLFVLEVAMARGVWWIIEQPASTLMFRHAPFEASAAKK